MTPARVVPPPPSLRATFAPKAMALVIAWAFDELLVIPPVRPMLLPLNVNALAPLLNVMPANDLPAAMLLVNFAPALPAVPKSKFVPAGTTAGFQLAAVFQL